MANEMSTYVTVCNADERVLDKLNKLLTPEEGQYEVNAVEFLNRMLGTNYSYNDKPEWNRETDWPTQDIWDSYIGPKWMFVDYDYSDEPEDCGFMIRSAWYVPSEFLEKLSKELCKIKEDCYIKGTYEDESYDPLGAFLYAKDWDDIEDLDEVIDYDRIWEDDDYREGLQYSNNDLRDSIEEAYKEHLKDKEENPSHYE
jgi:hypothetical protein